LDEDAQLADDTLPPGAQPSPLTVEADEEPQRRSRFAKMDEDAMLADDREWNPVSNLSVFVWTASFYGNQRRHGAALGAF
jgi:hypothetical protein